MPLTLESRLRCNPDALITKLPAGEGESEAVILNIATHKYFALNATGIHIWEERTRLRYARSPWEERLH